MHHFDFESIERICDGNLLVRTCADYVGKLAIFVFSSANAQSFTYFKNFELLQNVSRIYIRDPYFGHWYQNGVSAQVNSFNLLIEVFDNLIHVLSPSKVLFLGSSMGGYAAICASQQFDNSKFFAFSPQTLLDGRLPHNYKLYVKGSSPHEKIELKATDNGLIFYGASDIVDLFYMKKVSLFKKIIFPIYCGDHLIAARLLKNGFIKCLIEKWADDADIDCENLLSLYDEKLSAEAYDDDYLVTIDRLVESFYFYNKIGFEGLAYSALNKYDTFAIRLLLSVYYKSCKKYDEAINNLICMIGTNGNELVLHKELFENYNLVRDFEKAKYHGEIALKFRGGDYALLCSMAKLCFDLRDFESGRSFLTKAIKMRPHLDRATKIANEYCVIF